MKKGGKGNVNKMFKERFDFKKTFKVLILVACLIYKLFSIIL